MKYDYYRDYCNLAERLQDNADNSLLLAEYATCYERDDEAEQHRTIRMILEEALDRIAAVLAQEERNNPDIDPTEYIFCGKKHVKAKPLDCWFSKQEGWSFI